MKKQLTVIACVLGLVLPALAVPEKTEKTFDSKPGQRLVVDLKTGGKILVTGWKQGKVVVRVEGKSADELPLTVRQTEDGVEVETRFSSETANWKRYSGDNVVSIHVPFKYNLKLRSMGGSIEISGVSGEITGRTMGGDLKLSDLKGVVYMKTMGGDVTLKNSHVDGEVRTMGGRVLLEDVVGDVKGSSMGGNVIYRNVKKKPGQKVTDKVVRISTMGGTVNVDEAPEGADVHTMGGEITVKSAGKFIKAKTMGGDIHIDAIDGWVWAKTMGGDVKVFMVGNPAKGDRHAEIVSYGGDIELVVPANLSMDVDLKVDIFKNGHNDYSIHSDFGLKVKEEKEWRILKGKKVRTLRMVGKVGDGKNKVEIRTINGNIYLRKAKR